MGLNLPRTPVRALDGGVGGGEVLMVVVEMRCARVVESSSVGNETENVAREMKECVGREWVSDRKEHRAGRVYIYQELGTCIKEVGSRNYQM